MPEGQNGRRDGFIMGHTLRVSTGLVEVAYRGALVMLVVDGTMALFEQCGRRRELRSRHNAWEFSQPRPKPLAPMRKSRTRPWAAPSALWLRTDGNHQRRQSRGVAVAGPRNHFCHNSLSVLV